MKLLKCKHLGNGLRIELWTWIDFNEFGVYVYDRKDELWDSCKQIRNEPDALGVFDAWSDHYSTALVH